MADPLDPRAGDVLALSRLAERPGAVRAILDWLSRRTAGTAALLAEDGRVLAASRRRPEPGVLAAAARALPGLRRRGVTSAVVPGDRPHPVRLVRLGTGDDAPCLVVAAEADGALLADAARVLGLCRRLEEAERDRDRLRAAEAHSREAVLHLLMIGSVPAAQRIAATLRPALPPLARVAVVECPAGRRPGVAARIEDVTGGRAWLVPCPVRSRHLIALLPAAADALDERITEHHPECRVGVSAQVPLRETATGYEQAFHALAMARRLPERRAGFDGAAELAPLLGAAGRAWAHRLLAPVLSHTPARRADPGAQELLGTLASWLAFEGAAHRHLKIHRNTLAARVRLLGDLLGLDLTRLSGQSAAWLALRLHSGAAEAAATPAALPGLLDDEAVRAWAAARVHPLERRAAPATAVTVLAWLRADARLPAAAADLGISPAGARKRLARAEEALGRSLLQAPSAKHELWLAFAALGRCAP
ncbi:hypothetical protein GCM10027168_22360 [Streptomyces capparidis]